MASNLSKVINDVINFIDSINFSDVLKIAEKVADRAHVPFIGLIIDFLQWACKNEDIIHSAAPLAKDVANLFDSPENEPQPSTTKVSQREKEKFQQLVDIAKSDGIVTDEEREYLIPRGNRVGFSTAEIDKMLEF